MATALKNAHHVHQFTPVTEHNPPLELRVSGRQYAYRSSHAIQFVKLLSSGDCNEVSGVPLKSLRQSVLTRFSGHLPLTLMRDRQDWAVQARVLADGLHSLRYVASVCFDSGMYLNRQI